jgi:hypothetical protein
MRIPWLSFARWSSRSGLFLIAERHYLGFRWTPLIFLRKRYKTWLGYWDAVEDEGGTTATTWEAKKRTE